MSIASPAASPVQDETGEAFRYDKSYPMRERQFADLGMEVLFDDGERCGNCLNITA
jgi:hypothetical protein